MKRAIIIAILCAAGAVAAERPQIKLPETVPPADMRTAALDNGMKVSILPFGDVPKVSAQLVIETGNVDESANELWISDLLGQLLEQGTRELDAAGLARTTAAWGGELNVGVGENTITISGTVLAEHAAKLIELLSQIVEQPRLPAEELARLKADLVREMNLIKSRPQSTADAKLAELLYPGHAYGRSFPTEAMLTGYTLEQAKKFFDAHIHAGRAHLFVAGKLDPAAIEQVARGAFSDWRKGAPTPPRKVNARTARAIHFVERTGAVQSTVRLALPVITPGHPDYVALQVTNHLLGGGFSSRITSNIREQKGYTYSPFAGLAARQGAVHWAQNADVTTNVTGAALREIEKEIARLRAEAPPAQELDSVKANMVGTFLIQQSSREGRINWRRFVELHRLPADFDYVAAIRAVTPETVKAIARKYIDPARLTIVVVGDGKQVLPQLQGIARVVKSK
jgi:zinc protease